MADISIPLIVAAPVVSALTAGIVAMWRRSIAIADKADARVKEVETRYSDRVDALESELASMRIELRTEYKKSAAALILARDALASRLPSHNDPSVITPEDAEESTEISAGILPVARAQIEKMARDEIERNRRERLLKSYVDSDPPVSAPRPRMKSRS